MGGYHSKEELEELVSSVEKMNDKQKDSIDAKSSNSSSDEAQILQEDGYYSIPASAPGTWTEWVFGKKEQPKKPPTPPPAPSAPPAPMRPAMKPIEVEQRTYRSASDGRITQNVVHWARVREDGINDLARRTYAEALIGRRISAACIKNTKGKDTKGKDTKGKDTYQ